MKQRITVSSFYWLRSRFSAHLFISIVAIYLQLTQVALAAGNNAVPVVNTTISVAKTGSEPFDSSTWNGNSTTAGYDASEDNNVVRLQDALVIILTIKNGV